MSFSSLVGQRKRCEHAAHSVPSGLQKANLQIIPEQKRYLYNKEAFKHFPWLHSRGEAAAEVGPQRTQQPGVKVERHRAGATLSSVSQENLSALTRS